MGHNNGEDDLGQLAEMNRMLTAVVSVAVLIISGGFSWWVNVLEDRLDALQEQNGKQWALLSQRGERLATIEGKVANVEAREALASNMAREVANRVIELEKEHAVIESKVR